MANVYRKKSLLVAINCLAALSIFFFGYDQGMMGGVNNAQDYLQVMGIGFVDATTQQVKITNPILQGGIVAIYYFGTLIGCLLGGWYGDRAGRIKTIGIGAGWAVLGATLQCSAQNKDWMLCGEYPRLSPSLILFYPFERHIHTLGCWQSGSNLYSASYQWNWHGHAECYRSCMGY